MLFRLGQAFERLSSFIKGTERDLLPVIVKTGATVDRVNYQLDKADTVTDSAVSMADSADTAVRAISTAIATPVEKVSGLAAGISHGFSQFRKSKDFSEAKSAAQEAARQREADLHDDLRNAGRTPMETDRPPAQPRPDAQPKPDPWPRPTPVPKPDPAPVPPDEEPRPPPSSRWRSRSVDVARRVASAFAPGRSTAACRSCSGTRSATRATARSSTSPSRPLAEAGCRRSRSTARASVARTLSSRDGTRSIASRPPLGGRRRARR